MARSPGFGSIPCNLSPGLDSVSLRLAYTVYLATEYKSLTHYTKGTQAHPEGCSHCLYVHGFRVFFTPLAGVLFAFPSRYWFTNGQTGVFSLGGWSPHIQKGYHESRPTHRAHCTCAFVYGAVTLYRAPFQTLPLTHMQIQALGSSPFARRYWGNLG